MTTAVLPADMITDIRTETISTPDALEDQVRRYWNRRSGGFALQTEDELDGVFTSETAFGSWDDLLGQALAGLPPGASVCDMGCGPGALLLRAARMGFQATGLDLSEDMLGQARSLADEHGLSNVTLLQGSVIEPPFAPESFDAVVSRNVLWNLPEPEKALRAWVRCLRPGGFLVIGDGNHYLHLFDPRYARAACAQASEHDPKYIQGVDVSPMEVIARSLPLSRLQRPQWDCTVLEMLDVAVERFKVLSTVRDPRTDEDLTFEFFLLGRRTA